jgi:hypothetical protein
MSAGANASAASQRNEVRVARIIDLPKADGILRRVVMVFPLNRIGERPAAAISCAALRFQFSPKLTTRIVPHSSGWMLQRYEMVVPAFEMTL